MVAFIKRVFRASGRYRSSGPAELWIGGSVVMVSEADTRQPTRACLYVYVEDSDATCRRALRAGAVDRDACDDAVRRPAGHGRRSVGQPVADRDARAIVLTHRFQSRMPAAARSPAATTKLA